jgi:hypothetical protein
MGGRFFAGGVQYHRIATQIELAKIQFAMVAFG